MRKVDNLPPSCAVVTKSGNFNFLEPSEPLRARNRTALPLPLPMFRRRKLLLGELTCYEVVDGLIAFLNFAEASKKTDDMLCAL